MSKYVSCIINELEESESIGDDFELFVIALNFDDSGQICSTESIEPIFEIGIDIENEECLFYTKLGEKALEIQEAYAELETIESSFSLVHASEHEVSGSVVRIDNPVIGFGENIDEKRFVIVCRA